MADAGPPGSPRRLSGEVPQPDAHRRRAVCAVWGVERRGLFRSDSALLLRPVRSISVPSARAANPIPRVIQTAPRPDFFFLWLYALLSLLPPALETPVLLIGPAIVLIVLLALPFFSGEGEKSWKRRPIAVLTILLLAVALGDVYQSGEPHAVESSHGRLDRRSDTLRISERDARRSRSRARSFFNRNSATTATRSASIGGKRGPGSRRGGRETDQDQLVRQVLQGGGNMPAYGKNLNPAETTALVAFLETLHPAGQAPAQDASRTAELQP